MTRFPGPADRASTDLHRRLARPLMNSDFESDFNAGSLTIEFASPPCEFCEPETHPFRQIGYPAHRKASSWIGTISQRICVCRDGAEFTDLIGDAIGHHLGGAVTL